MFRDGVNLSKSAWYMRLLKFMWDYEPENFTNLCPLFWKVVLSIVVFVPWLVIILPIRLIAREADNNSEGILAKVLKIGEKAIVNLTVFVFNIFMGFICSVLLYGLLSGPINRAFYESIDDLILVFVTIFIIILIIVIIAAVAIVYTEYDERKRETALDGTLNSNRQKKGLLYRIFVKPVVDIFKLAFGYIKSIYNKNCPFINWKD